MVVAEGMMVVMPAGLDGDPNPISTLQREQLLGRVAQAVTGLRTAGKALLVGIDGIDGSGKSTFADELASRLADQDTPVVRSSVDSFHNPREVRWSKGKSSPVGFYLDSHNLAALRELLLDPMRAGPGANYRVAAFDEPTDQPVDGPAPVGIRDGRPSARRPRACRPRSAVRQADRPLLLGHAVLPRQRGPEGSG